MISRFASRSLSVLLYHRVLGLADPLRPGEPTAEEFEARMRWVASNYNVLSLSEAVRALREDRLPRRSLCISFDDGYADNFDIALPILRRVGLPATFFIATGFLDGGYMFNDAVIEAVRRAPAILDLRDLELGRHSIASSADRCRVVDAILARVKYLPPAQRDGVAAEIAARCAATVPAALMMTSVQVRALHASGMTLGAHTVTHPILAEISLYEAREEISQSRAQLERITGAAIDLFAYPNGRPQRDYRREHVEMVRELGFVAAVSTASGATRASGDLFQIPRFTPWDRPNWRFGLRLATNRLSSDYARA
jgi:peptidoglycan/xylan/chitin deacetylase (PgdA/CDA1 family)